jgi:2-polyprenyl-3-methyl-5-hydroxy-6-metoxy-1,4-benzoquinol methylase
LRSERLLEEEKRIGTWGKLNPARLEVIQKYALQKVLDAGCSTGEYVRWMLNQGYDAYGFDLLQSESWKGDLSDRFTAGDLHKTPYGDEEFDTVVSFEVLEHVEDFEKVLSELKRIAGHNLILSVPDTELYPVFEKSGLTFHHWVDRTHRHFFTEKELRKTLHDTKLEIQFLGRINPVHPEVMLGESLRIPSGLVKIFQKLMSLIPFRKKYCMTLIVVARKHHP